MRCAWLLLLPCLGCTRTEQAPEPAASATSPADAAAKPPKQASSGASGDLTADAPPAGSHAGAAPAEQFELPPGWVLDELADVAPAGPATPTSSGLVVISRDNQTHFAAYTPRAPADPPGSTQIAALDLPATELVAMRRGPAVLGSHAYWVAGRQLLRRALRGGELEVLAEDARHSTRVATPPSLARGEPAMVAYIAGEETLKARLWVEGEGTSTLSEDAASAISVALTRTSSGLVALSLDARTGMTSLHARPLSMKARRPALGDDIVVWVGGPADPLTEIVAGESGGQRLGFVAVSRTTTEFGLATFQLGDRLRARADVSWLAYPNGIDPAPVASATVCKTSVVLFAHPASSEPRALQELSLGIVDQGRVTRAAVVARSRAFANVSLAGGPRGGLFAYTADRRTWARAIRCR
ncbi:MAG: hypothetical protein KF915_20330 [Polyangiaceae bacterium]|nr:hypothetical protein [Polyangiaceae bacterium]